MKPGAPIRLFADAHVFDQEFQGSRTFIRELYSLLAKKEDIHLFLAAYDTNHLASFFPSSPQIRFIRYKRRSGWPRLLLNIPALLTQHRIDYAHFQYMIPPVKKCRYIVTIHDVIFEEYPREFPLPYRLSKKLLYKWGATHADIITTVSEYSKKSIEKFLGIAPGKTHIIPNGVSDVFFQPYEKKQAAQMILEKYGIGDFILYVSRFEPRKNHLALLNAYLELELYRKGYYLVLLGHRSLKVDGFDKRLGGLPPEIRQFIFISDRVKDDELLEFYRAASLFVYPSKAEGFGISPLEAAALKIPVICSNASAMKEFSFFGDMHIDPTHPDLLKERMRAVLSGPPDPQRLQIISAHIREQYSWKQAAEKFYNLLVQEKTVSSKSKQKANDQLSLS